MVILVKIPASECRNCGKVIVPERQICPTCGPIQKSMRTIQLPSKGKLLSFTVSHFPPSGFDSPVILGLIQLNRDATVLAVGFEDEQHELEIGMGVTLTYDQEKRLAFTA